MKTYTVRILLALSSILSVSAHAVDFGATIENVTGVASAGGVSLIQTDELALWFRAGGAEGVSFHARAAGRFSYENGPLFTGDVTQLRLAGSFAAEAAGPSRFSFELGRFRASEFSGFVFDHTIDGLGLEVTYPSATFSVSLGYTGLLLGPSSAIILTQADAAAAAEGALFASPRLVGAAQLSFTDLLPRHDLTLAALIQEDLRPLHEVSLPAEERRLVVEGETAFSPGKSVPLDTQYFGIGIDGAITGGLYYNALFFLQTGRTLTYLDDQESPTGLSYQSVPVLSLLAAAGVRWYVPEFLASSVALDFVYAGGDGDENAATYLDGNVAGTYGTFVPIAGAYATTVFSPKPSNLIYPRVSVSARPFANAGGSDTLERFQVTLSATPYFRATAGPISESGVDPAGDALYLGTEFDAAIHFRPTSDLGAALTGGLFAPNAGSAVFVAGSDAIRWAVKAVVSLSF